MRVLFAFFLNFCFSYGFDYLSIKSDFTQTITSPEGQVLNYSGRFYAKKPYFALWEYDKPIKKMVYFVGKTIKIVEPELEQVIISSLPQAPNISKLLKGAKKIKENLYNASYEDITYEIVMDEDMPRKVSYKDKLDNKVEIFFENTKLNTRLKNNIFDYKIPLDYDVLRQ